MKKEDCFWYKEWEYRENGIDWNQTILTLINTLSKYIHQTSFKGGANSIEIHSTLLPLIESLEYYSPNNQKLAGRYDVIINNENEESEIFVYYKEKGNDFLVMPVIEDGEDQPHEMTTIQFKLKCEFPQEQINLYESKLRGCIKVTKKFIYGH